MKRWVGEQVWIESDLGTEMHSRVAFPYNTVTRVEDYKNDDNFKDSREKILVIAGGASLILIENFDRFLALWEAAETRTFYYNAN